MKRIALALLVVVAACSSGAKRVGSQPSWRGTPAKPAPSQPDTMPVTFAPTSVPATRYNEPLQAPAPSPLGDAVTAAVREAAVKAGLPAPMPDARLFRACTELAEIAPDNGVIDYRLVEFAVQQAGIIEPLPYLLVMWGDASDPEKLVEQLRPRLSDILANGATARLGIGAAKRHPDGTSAVVFALQASDVATNPIPRSVEANGSFALDAVVDGRFHEPELFITRDNGTTERVAIEHRRSGAFKGKVTCGKRPGRQQIEITASDEKGSTVLANFPVWCGTQPPTEITYQPGDDDGVVVDATEAEKRLLALVNRDRQAAGLSALLWDDRVAAVARKYSEEMRTTKAVAHVSPTSGSGADRVRVGGIKTAVVLENVARAYGVGVAHASLMNSPGHRANLLSSTATHVGIGIVLGDELAGKREIYVTQVFIRIPPKIEPSRVAELVRERLKAVRPVQVNPRLTGVAQELADGLAAGKPRDPLWAGAKKKLDSMKLPYARLTSAINAVADMDSVDGRQFVGDFKADDVGIGIAQGNHPEIGEGAVWIVVLMAEQLPKRDGR